jgi:multidrug efflux pump subunit AcrA (membrane-fusion protein)
LENLRLARYNLEKTILTAPFDGRISSLKIVGGFNVKSSDIICLLSSEGPLEVRFEVLPHYKAYLHEDMEILVSPLSEPKVKYCQGRIIPGRYKVSEDGFLTVVGVLIGDCPCLMEGMKVKVKARSIISGIPKVPLTAVTLRAGRTVVFLLDKGKARWKEVEISERNESFYLVSDGIAYGDTVLVDGNLGLSDGLPVRLEELINRSW